MNLSTRCPLINSTNVNKTTATFYLTGSCNSKSKLNLKVSRRYLDKKGMSIIQRSIKSHKRFNLKLWPKYMVIIIVVRMWNLIWVSNSIWSRKRGRSQKTIWGKLWNDWLKWRSLAWASTFKSMRGYWMTIAK